MAAKWVLIGATLAAVAIGGAAISTVRLVPSCTDGRTTALVVKILSDELHVPGHLALHNIRVLSGSMLSGHWDCEAEVHGITGPDTAFGVKFNQVRYSSQVTADTHRQYVTARIVPFR